MPRVKGFRFPRDIIAYAVWAYHRVALSCAAVEGLLAERGVIVSRETVRNWVTRFGRFFAACIKRDRPRPADKWHLDEVVVQIGGETFWLWRAVDANGDALDILVQKRRNAKAAMRFFKRLLASYGDPRVVVTDKLRSYIKPIRTQASNADHRAHKGLNNRVEGYHRPTRKREKITGRFSNRLDKHKGSLQHMIRSTSFFAHAAIASTPILTDMHEPTRFGYGEITPWK